MAAAPDDRSEERDRAAETELDRPKHDPKMRASLEDDIYETALLGLVHIDADEVIDVRWLMPHPDRVPTDVETVMTMGEFRARVVNVRGLLAAEGEDSE